MTESGVAVSSAEDSVEAAAELSAGVADALAGASPDALVLFAPPRHDAVTLLRELKARLQPHLLLGASSAGADEDDARVLALRSSSLAFTATLGLELSRDTASTARRLAAGFVGCTSRDYPHRTALILADASAGHAEELIDELTLTTAGKHQFFGGSASDGARFKHTCVFFDEEVHVDAAVALEILSHKPIGIGVGQGWRPVGEAMRVTAVDGIRLLSLNGMAAVEAFARHAQASGQPLDASEPAPFFLHNILGIETGGGYRLRVPLSIDDDGSILCATALPYGCTVHIMSSASRSFIDATAHAAAAAKAALRGGMPAVGLLFDCAATRSRLGERGAVDAVSLSTQLGSAAFVGCDTHGQLARAEGQFAAFHNCTAVVCVLPR